MCRRLLFRVTLFLALFAAICAAAAWVDGAARSRQEGRSPVAAVNGANAAEQRGEDETAHNAVAAVAAVLVIAAFLLTVGTYRPQSAPACRRDDGVDGGHVPCVGAAGGEQVPASQCAQPGQANGQGAPNHEASPLVWDTGDADSAELAPPEAARGESRLARASRLARKWRPGRGSRLTSVGTAVLAGAAVAFGPAGGQRHNGNVLSSRNASATAADPGADAARAEAWYG